MFLGRQYWARQVIAEMGLPETSPLATNLLDMVLDRARRYHRLQRRTALKLSQLELVLMAVAAIVDDLGVLNRLATKVGSGPDEVASVLMWLCRAGRALAVRHDLGALVSQFDQLCDLDQQAACASPRRLHHG